jgi:hypothetical protein
MYGPSLPPEPPNSVATVRLGLLKSVVPLRCRYLGSESPTKSRRIQERETRNSRLEEWVADNVDKRS